MRQLSGLDASFLVLETPNTHMHVGGVMVFEGRKGQPFDFEHYREALGARLHVARVFRQRLLKVPFDLGRPYWVEDPAFDLDFHVHHMALPRPGGFRELAKLASHFYSLPLDHARPLWQMVFVEGLDALPDVPRGSWAILSKVHHAGIDGVSGAEVMGALLDTSPHARPVRPPAAWAPEPIPSDMELLARATGSAVEPMRIARLLGSGLSSALRPSPKPAAAALPVPRGKAAPFEAPTTRLNAPITSHRSWYATRFPLERVRALRKAVTGATVNDVVLAVVSGALRRWLREKEELPQESLVAMAPVSVRRDDEKASLGNQISVMLVRLATEEADPLKRLAFIQQATARTKSHHKGVGARTLSDVSQVLPFSLAGAAARLYTRMEVSRLHRPIFNLIVTNVPGPQVPLYFGGARLLASFGQGPIFDGVGVIIVVFSYAGTITLSVTACREVMPDADLFCSHLDSAIEELEQASRPRQRVRRLKAAPAARVRAPRRRVARKLQPQRS